MFRLIAASLCSLAATSAAGEFSLRQPVDCDLGETCHIQHYMDRDPGPGAQDYRCGKLSYDGHQGTDFALPTLAEMRAGVAVLAAAGGTVRATRDGMQDRIHDDNSALDGRDCGNGVVIDHAEGWQTQYCHMRRGSIAVAQGQEVTPGQRLGEIGLSGRTQFPHLHLTLRRDGQVIDPFEPNAAGGCDAPPEPSLWQDALPDFEGGIIDVGLAEGIPEYDRVKDGTAAHAIAPGSPAIVIFGLAYGGQQGDTVELSLTGPEGTIIQHSTVLTRDQAQFFRAAGRKRRDSAWQSGLYSGTVTLIRDGRELGRLDVRQELP